ncbi:MAG: hypothetical protein ACNA8L_06550, partial [Luteolibacter sp.]
TSFSWPTGVSALHTRQECRVSIVSQRVLKSAMAQGCALSFLPFCFPHSKKKKFEQEATEGEHWRNVTIAPAFLD